MKEQQSLIDVMEKKMITQLDNRRKKEEEATLKATQRNAKNSTK